MDHEEARDRHKRGGLSTKPLVDAWWGRHRRAGRATRLVTQLGLVDPLVEAKAMRPLDREFRHNDRVVRVIIREAKWQK